MGPRFRFFGLGPEGALALVLTLAVALGYLAARDAPVLEAMEGRTLDWRFRIRGPLQPGADIVLVTLDDRTLDVLGRWPVSRTWLARAVDTLAADGAAAIAFDLLFLGAESDPAADARLVRAVADAGTVVVPFAFTFSAARAEPDLAPLAIARGAYSVTHRPAGLRAGPRLVPTGVLMPAAALLAAGVPAHVTMILDGDGVLRRTHPVIGYGGAYFPALPIAAARIFLRLAPSEVVARIGEGLDLGSRRIASDMDMSVPLNYLGPAGRFPAYSLIDVVEGRIRPGAFRGRAVLIGATAQGLGDRFATPYAQSVPGVEIFASALDNILEGRGLERSARTVGLDLLAISICGMAAAALALQGAALVTVMAGLAAIALWGAVCLVAFEIAHLWLNFVFPATAAALGTLSVAAAQSLRERGGRRRAERARTVLARYVSPLVGVRTSADGSNPAPVSERQAAVMFADLRGFTAASERLSPEETMNLLRGYHRRVEQAVARHQGKIDKFIGDGALVVFGADHPVPAAAAHALACARDLAGSAAAWTQERVAQGVSPIHVSIGIHFGPVMLGEVGGDDYAQMTVAGDTVNVASRLEGLTRTHRVTILASDALVAAAKATGATLEGLVELPMQEIRGRRQRLRVWAWPAPENPPEAS